MLSSRAVTRASIRLDGDEVTRISLPTSADASVEPGAICKTRLAFQIQTSAIRNASVISVVLEDDSGSTDTCAEFDCGEATFSTEDTDRLKPDFAIIGAMKAGTTALYDFLTRHPQVLPRMPKEIRFFNESFDLGLDYYRSCFAGKLAHPLAAGVLAGDGTPGYMSPYHPECAARLREFAPHVRIVVSLRDPVERAISHYYHNAKMLGTESRSLEAVFAEAEFTDAVDQSAYLRYGRYAECLRPWLAAFPRQQVLVLDFHDLERRPAGLLRDLFAFVGLDVPPGLHVTKIFGNEYPEPPEDMIRRLQAYYAPLRSELRDLLGHDLSFTL
ncbi:sulfotransferase family protein [Nannocystis punicea]|uniref:Sulfotransferase n=1 Tax=Nannocystis punicea TaxID=2995304 RepID=A0ABY7HBV2_9BACT|nr:sulfotransferase [Nannocystis poenicansa]WAS96742.1 sulfotransferase [Nannocystis poenicansa]